MKILFLTPWYPNPEKSINHGIFVRDQAVALSGEHQIEVISSEVDYDRFHVCEFEIRKSTFEKVSEHRLIIKRSLPIYNQFNYFLISLIYIYKVIKRFRPDVIHGNIGFPSACWAWVMHIFFKTPFVVTEHFSQFKANFRSGFHKVTTLYPMRRANALVAVSNHTASEIESYKIKRPFVVGNIIDFKKFTTPKTKIPSDLPVFHIGFLGVLENHKKGLEILLRALAPIKQKYVLHVGGSGVLVPYYQKLARELGIENNCKFHGFVAYWDVSKFMEQLDFFVSASKFESFGMVIVEAMAMGLPVVATDSGGPKDFVNEKNGVLVLKDNPALLQQGIEKMMITYQKYDPNEIRKFAYENYSEEVFLTKINAIYKSIT